MVLFLTFGRVIPAYQLGQCLLGFQNAKSYITDWIINAKITAVYKVSPADILWTKITVLKNPML